MSKANDDLLRKARKIKKESDAASRMSRRKNKESVFGKTQRHVEDIHDTYLEVSGGIGWIYRNIIKPVVTHRWFGAPFRAYRNVWDEVVYVPDKDGDEVLSKKRAGWMVISTLVFLWLLPSIISTSVEFVWDTSRMATSYKKEEVWYLGKSQEIDHEGNVFSAQGCASIQCNDQTSIYFRIKPSLAHHMWSFMHNGNVFFPDFVAAGIQNDINKCKVTGYGSRWKFLVRNWDIYPQILSVDCVPVTETDINKGQGILD